MAQGYASELQGVLDGTLSSPGKSDGRVVGAKLRVYQATLDLSQTAVKRANGDTNVLARIPAGSKVLYGILLASATMGANATVAIGTAAAAGKYRAAATFTTANVPTPFMLSAAADDDPLTADEDVILTVGHADGLPGAGILQVFLIVAAR